MQEEGYIQSPSSLQFYFKPHGIKMQLKLGWFSGKRHLCAIHVTFTLKLPEGKLVSVFSLAFYVTCESRVQYT